MEKFYKRKIYANYHVWSSSLKNITSKYDSLIDKLAILRIPLSSNEKLSSAISHNLIVSSLYFDEFLDEDCYEQLLDPLHFDQLSYFVLRSVKRSRYLISYTTRRTCPNNLSVIF